MHMEAANMSHLFAQSSSTSFAYGSSQFSEPTSQLSTLASAPSGAARSVGSGTGSVGGGSGLRGFRGSGGGGGVLDAFKDITETVMECRSNGSSLTGEVPWPLAISGGGGWSDSDVEFKMAIDVYLVSVLCLIGFVGNAVTVAVLRADPDCARNSTNWLLQMLAIVDFVYLAACVFIHPLKALYDTDSLGHSFLESTYPYIEPYVWPIASISQTLTVWTVLLVTVDRYIAVCRPLKRNLRSVTRTKVTAAIGSVLAVLYNVPLFFERVVAHPQPCSVDAPLLVPPVAALTQQTALRGNLAYFIVYKTICYFLFRSGGPLVVMIYVNILLLRALRVRRRRLVARGLRHHHGGSVTAMLVAVVTVFIVCELPDAALRTTAAIFELYQLRGGSGEIGADADRRRSGAVAADFLMRANSVTNALLAVNSSVNFIIYCLVGTKFREILVRRLRFVFCGRPCPCCCYCRRSRCCQSVIVGSTIVGGGRFLLHDCPTAVVPPAAGGGLLDVYRSAYGGHRHLAGVPASSSASNRAPFAPRSPTVDCRRQISTISRALLQTPELVIGVDPRSVPASVGSSTSHAAAADVRCGGGQMRSATTSTVLEIEVTSGFNGDVIDDIFGSLVHVEKLNNGSAVSSAFGAVRTDN
jgi:hypothetical protein